MSGVLDAITNYKLRDQVAQAAEARKAAQQEGLIRQAMALQAFGGQPGTQSLDPLAPVPGLNGVTDTTPPLAGLQQELANDRLEQTRQQALPGVAELAQTVALARAGLDPASIANAGITNLRRNLLEQNVPGLPLAARVNAANAKDVSPVRSEGGVFYDRFNPQVPFIGMSEPAAAQADQRWAASRASDASAQASMASAGLSRTQQQTADLRLNVLREALSQPGLDPLMGADMANAKQVGKSSWLKVRDPGGGADRYFQSIPKAGGGFDNVPATGPDGKPLQVPVSDSGDGGTALQKDVGFISQVLGLPPEKAILYKLESRGKGDQALRDDISLRMLSDPGSARTATSDPAKFNAQVDAVFKALRPDQPVPAPTAAPAAGAGLAGGAAAPQGGAYSTPDDVGRALRAGKISPEQAKQVLRDQFQFD